MKQSILVGLGPIKKLFILSLGTQGVLVVGKFTWRVGRIQLKYLAGHQKSRVFSGVDMTVAIRISLEEVIPHPYKQGGGRDRSLGLVGKNQEDTLH